jgi:hypothetical protein
MKLVSIAFAALVAVGCSAPAAEPTAHTISRLSRADACLADAAAKNVTEAHIATHTVTFPAQAPIAGALVCLETLAGEQHQCITTGADGTGTFTVDPCTDWRQTFAAAGYLGANQLNHVDTADITIGTRLVTLAQAQALAHAMGTTYDTSKPLVVIGTYSPGHVPLAGVSLSEENGSTAWYLSGAGVPTTSLGATSGAGLMGFLDPPFGTTEVTATAPGKTCRPIPSMAGGSPNAALVEVIPGSLNEALIECE